MAFKINNETKIGILASIGITLIILGYNFLLGKDVFTSTNTFYARYETLDGLTNANPVKIRGMNVGRVTELVYAPGSKYIMVKFSVKSDIKVPTGTVAKIINADILGAKAIELEMTENTTFHNNKDELKSDIQKGLGSKLDGVEKQVTTTLYKVDSVIKSINNTFNPEMQKNLQSSVKNLSGTLDNVNKSSAQLSTLLAKNNARLQKIFENIESITNTVKENQDDIAAIMNNLSSITDSIKRSEITQTINNTSQVLAKTRDVLTKIDKGEGSMGLLLNDPKLYNDLDATAKSLNELLTDLKSNPGSYIHFSLFGRKNKKQ